MDVMETCFKLINREYFDLNKTYEKLIEKLKHILKEKTKKEKETIIDRLRLIRKAMMDLRYKMEDFIESPTLEDELHLLELENEKRIMEHIQQLDYIV